MEETDVNSKVIDDIKQSMEAFCRHIDESRLSQDVILHHLQALVEKAIDDKTISVSTSIHFYDDALCKEGIEFKVVLSWNFADFGPVIWLHSLKKLVEYLNVSDFKLIPKDNTLELYIPFYTLGVAVGCDEELLNDKVE